MILPSVDLPEPDGPMMPRHSPGARLNDTPFSIKWPDPGTAHANVVDDESCPSACPARALTSATGVTADMTPLSRR